MQNGSYKETIELNEGIDVRDLFGNQDAHLNVLEESLAVSLVSRGGEILISGEEENVKHAKHVIAALLAALKNGNHLDGRDVAQAVKMEKGGTLEYFGTLFEDEITKNAHGKPVRPKTFGQREYMQMVRRFDIVFGIGPAGTGKTYLAVVMAIDAWKKGKVSKIILTRPAVEAGESLGFLPGDLKEKVDPYLRPVYDALYDILGLEHTTRLMERGVIEIAPLAYMRGRTLDNAFVILDEAQNTTIAQMKMFFNSLGL
ncbi:PhoH family protein [Listeria aquatica FSL S10-1188]|uniref:PhoH-like protein n=1 Tax=Listeria aquatica FSL S10-1188 TaxID=1265818 RepID=W7BB73_9LIST|nr:PhoH family protein [Listeria aquatica FSL S10-1188]